jgi:hypothetical protein
MSSLSQFAPFASGGLKSFQTGYVSVNVSSLSNGSAEDSLYLDVGLSSVTASKTITAFQGSLGSNTYGMYSGYAGEATLIPTTRMISSTVLRIAVSRGLGGTLQGRWQAAEAN